MKSAVTLGLASLTHQPTFHPIRAQGPTPEPAGESTNGGDAFLDLMGYVGSRMEPLGVPGVAVGVVHERTRHTCGLGVTNVEKPGQVRAQTPFRVASLSRLLTASAVAALIDEDVLSLDDTVQTHLPSFRVRDPDASREVTIRHLLTNSAGWQGAFAVDGGAGDDALARYVDAMAGMPQLSAPGTLFTYSNPGFILAGHLIAQVTGQTFESAVRDLTLSQLSMNQATFLTSEVDGEKVAYGHMSNGESLSIVDPLQSTRVEAPVNGLFTNVDELLQFAAFNASSWAAPTFLSASLRGEMHRSLGPGGSMGPLPLHAMGMGWMLMDIGDARVSLHAGTDFAQSAMIAVIPSTGFAIVVLTNANAGQALAMEAVNFALERFLGLRQQPLSVIDMPESGLDHWVGTYQMPEGLELLVESSGRGLHLDTVEHGRPLTDISGDLAFVSTMTAEIRSTAPPRLVDFVRGPHDTVDWVRHLGQLAVRVEA